MKEIYDKSIWMESIAEQVMEENSNTLGYIKKCNVSVGYMESNREKKGRRMFLGTSKVNGDCQKVKPIMKKYCPHDFLITFYMPNIANMNDEQIKILMFHELLHIGAKIEDDGTLKTWTNDHDIQEFQVIADRYGLDWA